MTLNSRHTKPAVKRVCAPVTKPGIGESHEEPLLRGVEIPILAMLELSVTT